MFQVPEKSHLFHLFYGPPIVRFTFITVHNISVYGTCILHVYFRHIHVLYMYNS